MTTLIPIHSAAMLYVDQVRRSGGVGARSSLYRGLALMSGVPAAGAVYVGDSTPARVVIGRQPPPETGGGRRETENPRNAPRGGIGFLTQFPSPVSRLVLPALAKHLDPPARPRDSRRR